MDCRSGGGGGGGVAASVTACTMTALSFYSGGPGLLWTVDSRPTGATLRHGVLEGRAAHSR